MRAFDSTTSAFCRILPALAAGVALAGASVPTGAVEANDSATTTPIKHVIVIIGENRTFDHVFATYQPVNKGETSGTCCRKGSSSRTVRRAFVDGHPASSKLILFEGFVKKIVDAVQANPKLWDETAIMVTFDEGGGYWDSGYIQPLDFFGDGTRIAMIVVSPYSAGGHVSHGYSDHASILKFIEANWRLGPVSPTGRDALPNPLTADGNPYVPVNSPALSDMMDMFDFTSKAKN
jgi:phospholipase C